MYCTHLARSGCITWSQSGCTALTWPGLDVLLGVGRQVDRLDGAKVRDLTADDDVKGQHAVAIHSIGVVGHLEDLACVRESQRIKSNRIESNKSLLFINIQSIKMKIFL